MLFFFHVTFGNHYKVEILVRHRPNALFGKIRVFLLLIEIFIGVIFNV